MALRVLKSFHNNGLIQSLFQITDKGLVIGRVRVWKESGEVWLDEIYRKGEVEDWAFNRSEYINSLKSPLRAVHEPLDTVLGVLQKYARDGRLSR